MKRILSIFSSKTGVRFSLDDLPDCLIQSVSQYIDLSEAVLMAVLNRRFRSLTFPFHADQMDANEMRWFLNVLRTGDAKEIDVRFCKLRHLKLHAMVPIAGFNVLPSRVRVFDSLQSVATLTIPNSSFVQKAVFKHLYSAQNVPSSRA